MTYETAIGLTMLGVMIAAIFIGFPISFTLLFLAFAFGWWGLGDIVFNLAYFQTIGLMKESLLAAVPLFIFMGFVAEQAGLMERLFVALRLLLAPVRGSLFIVVIVTAAARPALSQRRARRQRPRARRDILVPDVRRDLRADVQALAGEPARAIN